MMYILTCNNLAICASEDKNKLEKQKAERIESIKNDSNFEVIRFDEDSIAYYTGISYEENKYEISELEII